MINIITKVAPSTVKNKSKSSVPSMIKQIRPLIICEAIFGIHRVYLLENSRPLTIISYFYSILVSTIIIATTINVSNARLIIMFLKQAFLYGYMGLVSVSLITSKKKLKKFFRVLQEFDDKMRLFDHTTMFFSARRIGFCSFGIVLLNFLLFLILTAHFNSLQSLTSITGILCVCTVNDLEVAFFVLLQCFVYTRLVLLKRQVCNLFGVDRTLNSESISKIEFLLQDESDISYLHNMYALLSKAAVILSSVMSFPMLVMFTTVGINTLAMSNLFVDILINGHHIEGSTFFLTYILLRCVKSTLLLAVPCCGSSMTGLAVGATRAALHDALNVVPMEDTQRRKVKTFIQLTKTCDFRYAVCKILKLDMTLFLKYLSLCITYLVIIIQFSKIIN